MKRKTVSITGNEKGSVIIIAVMVLALLTIIGIAAINKITVELQIVRNDAVHKDQFYRAESAAMQGARWVENADGPTLTTPGAASFLGLVDFVDPANPDMSDTRWQSTGPNSAYTVIDQSGPIDLSAPSNLYTYKIYGIYQQTGGLDSGQALIEIGYKKRF